MSKNGFINQLLDNANQFYATSLKQFKFYKKLLGTKVIVTRVNQDSKYKTVFGNIYNTTLIDDEDKTEFDYIVLINMNDMKNIYQKMIDQLDFYDNEDKLRVGDILTFSRKSQEYKFKIIRQDTFSEAGGVLNRYQIQGLIETNALI